VARLRARCARSSGSGGSGGHFSLCLFASLARGECWFDLRECMSN
jgi:hypothetical protein